MNTWSDDVAKSAAEFKNIKPAPAAAKIGSDATLLDGLTAFKNIAPELAAQLKNPAPNSFKEPAPLSANVARCAMGFKSADVLSNMITIGGVVPVKPGAAAVLIPKSAKKQRAPANNLSGKTDFAVVAPGQITQIGSVPSIFKQAALASVIGHIQALTPSANPISGQQVAGPVKSLSLYAPANDFELMG